MTIPFRRSVTYTLQSHLRTALSLGLIASIVCGIGISPIAHAQQDADTERAPSRLGKLLLKRSNLFLPSRLTLGMENRFVIKAQPGSQVRLLLSAEDRGYRLPNGTPLRVGPEYQELTGVIPTSGVLELVIDMPNEEDLHGETVYVEAVVGSSDADMAPIDIMDPAGRRADHNALTIAKQASRGGPAILPNLPGMNPQMLQQLSTMGSIYSNDEDPRRQLLDTGDINRELKIDQNPFNNRGVQPGLR